MAVICNMQDVSDVRSERRIPLGNLGGRLPAICQRMGHLLDMATDGTPNVTMRFSYEPLTVFTQKRGKKIKLFYGKVSRELEHRASAKQIYQKQADYSAAEYHSRQNMSRFLPWNFYCTYSFSAAVTMST